MAKVMRIYLEPGSSPIAGQRARQIDGVLGFAREWFGFEGSDKRVPAHQYYCRKCGEVFAGERRRRAFMGEHLRSHVNKKAS
jgi:hypothetical protein